jgi:hypothetical protein
MTNNYSKNKHCKCGKSICNDSDHCKKCSQIGELNHRFTTGITVTKHYCSKCKKEITGRGKTGLCTECHHLVMTGKGNPNFNGGKDRFPCCIDCGKKLASIYSTRCKSCGIKYSFKIGDRKVRDVSGENNPMFGVHRFGKDAPTWIDGRSFEPYAPEFNENLKEIIRNRDNHICQNCGMTEEEHLIVMGTVLIIHHIDYNKQNSEENNLITVCNSCNIRANYNRDYWQSIYQQKVKIS